MKFLVIPILFCLTSVENKVGSEADDILGLWVTSDGRAKVEFYKTEGLFHGKIVWLKNPRDENGEVHKDENNFEPSLRDRPIMGIDLVSGFVYDGNGKWEGGKIYNPDNGKTYSCLIRMKDNELKVRGYLGIPMFGRTVTWSRTDE